MIQGKFEDFKRSVTAKAERFSEVDNFAKRLVAEGHTDTVVIKEQQDILRFVNMWHLILRAVFNHVSKVISQLLLWLCITTLCDWLKNLAPLYRPMKNKAKTSRD